ncbi:hypothetical protein [Emcibacter sp.]|uniref:hypothetical protein n=1 Tax=Emcibacter sp. TaxID=1979954 RepID=UPI002AA8F7F7|nr:hypothetical protein [Emcibacter sp.]
MRLIILLLSLTLGIMAGFSAQAEPTEISIHVLSKDAKFIGSSMGGMRITLRDAHSGEILATGLTTGGTGNTKLLMHKDGGRRAVIVDKTAGGFHTTIDLDEPRLIEVEAKGPMAQMQSAHRIVSSQWVVPGKHITAGNGWILELPGFVVDILSPPAALKMSSDTKVVKISANVVMMCGCPTEPDGIWDSSKFEIKAIITHNGKKDGTLDMVYSGPKSQYTTSLPIDKPGLYEVTVYAYDPSNGNTGLDKTTFQVLGK